jgi:hypothetical protein
LRAELERLPDDAYLAILRGADTFFAARYGRFVVDRRVS